MSEEEKLEDALYDAEETVKTLRRQLAEKDAEIERLKAQSTVQYKAQGIYEIEAQQYRAEIERLTTQLSESPWITMPCKEEELPKVGDLFFCETNMGNFHGGEVLHLPLNKRTIRFGECYMDLQSIRRFMIIPK